MNLPKLINSTFTPTSASFVIELLLNTINMVMWRGFVLLSVLILIGACLASPATRTKEKLQEKCLFNDESYETKVVHVYVCAKVNVTLERRSTRSHAFITIESRDDDNEEETGVEDSGVLRLSEVPKLIKGWEKMESFDVSIFDVEFESEKETLVNIFKEMGIDSQKVVDLEASDCPGFGLNHLRHMNQLWSLTVTGTFEGVDSEGHIGQVLPQLRSLVLQEIELGSLPSLKGLKYLEEFSIDCSLCDKIPEKYFVDNEMLTFVHINAPEMKMIGQDLCRKMKRLESLYLMMNHADLPPLKDCVVLREFVIYNLDEIDSKRTTKRHSPDLTGLKQLRTLMLENSGIDSVPMDTIKANPHLYDINLSYNNIKEVPPKTFAHLGDLQALDLSGNNITAFSDSSIPETLIYLNVKETLLREYVPKKVLPNLYALQLSENQLTGVFSLKPFIENYHALCLFNLESNLYTSVDLSGPFYAKEDAIEIDLSYNRITTVKVDPQTVGRKAADDETRINLDLAGNPLKCDCDLRPFVEALRQENSNVYLKYDVKCADLKGKTLKTIQLEEMKC